MRILIFSLFFIIFLSCSTKTSNVEVTLSTELAKKYIEMKRNYSKRKLNIALKQVNEIINKKKDFVNAHFMRGKIYFFSGNLVKAKLSLKKAISLNPYHIDSLFWLARISSYKKSQWDLSEKYLKRIKSNSQN